MITFFLVVAAAALLFADQILAAWDQHRHNLPALDRRHALAALLIAAAVASAYWQPAPADDNPTPETVPSGDLNLAGLFTGPTAADDAAALAALCNELAEAVEYDGKQTKPRLLTGWAIADLRATARDIRLKGQTFGDRQPQVRDAVKRYLERPDILGKGGGPLGADGRAKWVASFRDIARAAEAAVR